MSGGGSKYDIQAYMTGLRRDVIVALKIKADGGQHAFAVDSASNVPTAAPL